MGQRRPIQVAAQTCLQFLNRDGMWLTQEPPCSFSTRITSVFLFFELSTWMDEGDFSFIFLRSWHNLRLRWISCPLHFSAYISEFFLASVDFIPFFKVATKEFSFHSTPNTLLLLSGVTGVFLHGRCIPQQNSQWQFWASVCVCWCNIWIYVKLLFFFILSSPFNNAGACSTFGILHATKLLPLVGRGGWSPPCTCRIQLELLNKLSISLFCNQCLFRLFCMLQDSVPDGSLQWSSSCLVCVRVWYSFLIWFIYCPDNGHNNSISKKLLGQVETVNLLISYF